MKRFKFFKGFSIPLWYYYTGDGIIDFVFYSTEIQRVVLDITIERTTPSPEPTDNN